MNKAVEPRKSTDGPRAAEPQPTRSASLPTRSRCEWKDGLRRSARARTRELAAAECLVGKPERVIAEVVKTLKQHPPAEVKKRKYPKRS